MSERKSLKFYELKHGDIVYMSPKQIEKLTNGLDCSSSSALLRSSEAPPATAIITSAIEQCPLYLKQTELDDIDKALSNQTGLISRGTDSKLCRHGANGKCVHCTPLEPYDPDYMKEHNIKHMSFHAYLRKLQSGIDKYVLMCLLSNSYYFVYQFAGANSPYSKTSVARSSPAAVVTHRGPRVYVPNASRRPSHSIRKPIGTWTASPSRIQISWRIF